MVRKIVIRLVLLSVLAALVLGACAAPLPTPTAVAPAAGKPTAEQPVAPPAAKPTEKPAPPPATKPAIPETVTFGVSADAATLDAHMDMSMPGIWPYANIYEGLTSRDKDNKLQPLLAESWKAVDNLTWEFKLRKGVKFHNGEDFNAEVVKFNLERVKNPDTKSVFRSEAATIDRVEVVDPYTVRIKTSQPDPVIPARLYVIKMVSPKYLQEKGPTALVGNPVGTGPYKFVEQVKGERIVLEANKDYWGGEPKVKRAILKTIPETASRVAALQTGAVDITWGITPEQAESLKGDPNLKVIARPSASMGFTGINLVKEGPLRDRRVRQAIAYAIDMDTIIAKILVGNATRLGAPLIPEVFGHDPAITPYLYDPSKAKVLLAEAGYAGGFDMAINTVTGRYLKGEEIIQAIAGYLSQVGIRAKVQTMDLATFLQRFGAKQLDEMWYMTYALFNFDGDGVLTPLWSSKGVYSFYSNPSLDKLVEEARGTMDEGRRKTLYSDALKLMKEEVPAATYMQLKDIWAMKKSIEFQPRVDIIVYFNDLFK